MRAATSERARLSTVATSFFTNSSGTNRASKRGVPMSVATCSVAERFGSMSSGVTIGFLIAGSAATGGGATGASGASGPRFSQNQAPAARARRTTPPRIQRPRFSSGDVPWSRFSAYMGLTLVDTGRSGIILKDSLRPATVPLAVIPPTLIPLTPEMPAKDMRRLRVPARRRRHPLRAAHDCDRGEPLGPARTPRACRARARGVPAREPPPRAAARRLAAASARAVRRLRLCPRAGRRDARGRHLRDSTRTG